MTPRPCPTTRPYGHPSTPSSGHPTTPSSGHPTTPSSGHPTTAHFGRGEEKLSPRREMFVLLRGRAIRAMGRDRPHSTSRQEICELGESCWSIQVCWAPQHRSWPPSFPAEVSR
jgi:hypothetical protein